MPDRTNAPSEGDEGARLPVTAPTPHGLVVIDKSGGWTSHDVVARMRRLAKTRKVGHAGTLDPMATGVLILGIGRGTKLLGHLALHDKEYLATIRLGQTTVTDDAEGEVLRDIPTDGVTEAAVRRAIADLTGPIMQRPSAVSAIKVDGRRAYARVRAGETVELPARPVVVNRFDLVEMRGGQAGAPLLLDVAVECTTGTYIRALARDLGAALGVGGHLVALRRTRVGGFTLADAVDLESCEAGVPVVPLAAAVRASFPIREVDALEAAAVGVGKRLPLVLQPGLNGLMGPSGEVLALAEPGEDGLVRYQSVLV